MNGNHSGNKLLLSCLLTLAFALGCNRKSAESQTQATKVYSEAELDKLITPGMSIADVTNRFGPPGSAVTVSENTILLTYMFPFEVRSPEEGVYLTGFDIDVKGGRVLRWSPITGMTGKTIQGGTSQRSLGEKSFQIFLAADSLTNLVNIVESEGSADASNLKVSPNLVFRAKVFAESSGNERPGKQTVILVVSEPDVLKLKGLTENNFGKRLLIVCHNQVIAAPLIKAPISTKKFMFPVKDARVLDKLNSTR